MHAYLAVKISLEIECMMLFFFIKSDKDSLESIITNEKRKPTCGPLYWDIEISLYSQTSL